MSETMMTPRDFSPYPWMKFALQEYGQREVSGAGTNPRIATYLAMVGQGPSDETAWCSAFANWCMHQAGLLGTMKANARSWLKWGTTCGAPRYGAVTILWRGSPNSWQGHVGFFVGLNAHHVILLGGNQHNSVSLSQYSRHRVLGYRSPW